MTYRYEERESSHGFTAGVIAGAVIGAGLALLWAPRSGNELRQIIGESADTMRAGLSRRVRGVADRVNDGLDELHDRVDRYAQKAEAEVREVRSQVGEPSL
jgi:gas vesicle protein